MKAQFSIESSDKLLKDFGFKLIETTFNITYKYIKKIKWWEFWRWGLLKTDNYILSRASEIILIHKVSSDIKKEIDKELK